MIVVSRKFCVVDGVLISYVMSLVDIESKMSLILSSLLPVEITNMSSMKRKKTMSQDGGFSISG
jgi:hypothetical protein